MSMEAAEKREVWMRLQIEGLDSAKPRFRYFWGKYVIGFRPAMHCQQSLVIKDEAQVRPTMIDGVYDLDASYQFFYLCGVGFKQRHHTNVHLAVRPMTGSVAAVGSAYGVRFTIWDAQAIPIKHPMLLESPPSGLDGLKVGHIGCKNFQFGCQVFEVDVVGKGAEGVVVTTLRDRSALRINQTVQTVLP
jgi:hypothetical protein